MPVCACWGVRVPARVCEGVRVGKSAAATGSASSRSSLCPHLLTSPWYPGFPLCSVVSPEPPRKHRLLLCDLNVPFLISCAIRGGTPPTRPFLDQTEQGVEGGRQSGPEFGLVHCSGAKSRGRGLAVGRLLGPGSRRTSQADLSAPGYVGAVDLTLARAVGARGLGCCTFAKTRVRAG